MITIERCAYPRVGEAIYEAVRHAPPGDPMLWDRYENPFERKWTWRNKRQMPEAIDGLVRWMHAAPVRGYARPLRPDDTHHYTGLFRYDPGDHLSLHLDAGIHPTNGLTHAVTRLVYLGNGGGDLEFWDGFAGNAGGIDPLPIIPLLSVAPAHGMMVTFDNRATAFHGVTPNDTRRPRFVVTVSFLSAARPVLPMKRAFFVPRPDEQWTDEMYALRDRRADPEKYAEAYRA